MCGLTCSSRQLSDLKHSAAIGVARSSCRSCSLWMLVCWRHANCIAERDRERERERGKLGAMPQPFPPGEGIAVRRGRRRERGKKSRNTHNTAAKIVAGYACIERRMLEGLLPCQYALGKGCSQHKSQTQASARTLDPMGGASRQ